MASKSDILAARKARSEEISKMIRLISFGLIALVYTTLSSSSDFSHKMVEAYENCYLMILIFSSLSIASDYLQFFCGYKVAKNVDLNKPDPDVDGGYKYDKDSYWYSMMIVFYNLKQIFLAIAVVFLMYIIIGALF